MMGLGQHAMQIKGGDSRAFNPDRDMVWAMPRLFRAALESMGKMQKGDLIEFFKKNHIELPGYTEETLFDGLQYTISHVAKYFNELHKNPRLGKDAKPFLDRIFSEGGRYMLMRMLIAEKLMARIFAELPTWFAMIAPKSLNDPLPSVEEVEEAANGLLAMHTGEEPDRG